MNAKDFTPTQEMVNAATLVFMCKAMVETLRPVVEGYQKEILVKHKFKVRDEFADRRGEDRHGDEAITDPNLSYLMPDEDFKIYDAECKAARDAHGLHVESDDFCPLLVAENELRKAQHLLVDAMEPLTGVSHYPLMCNFSEYDKYIDLTLRLLAPYVENPLKEKAA